MTATLNILNICVMLTSISLVISARILGIFHIPTYSHFVVGDRIFKELAARGHEVTVISPYELETPVKNLKHIVLTTSIGQFKGRDKQLFNGRWSKLLSHVRSMSVFGISFTESVLKDDEVQKLLQSNETFDLVIQENLFSEAFAGFSYHYKAPHILVHSPGGTRWASPKMGNPNNPSYIPDTLLSYSSDMNIFQRIVNTITYAYLELSNHLSIYPQQNELLQKYFPGAPHLYDLIYNTSLMLLNSHSSTSDSVPLLPNMIEIGGHHIQSPRPISKDLQDYLDNASDGFILCSLGSRLESKHIPQQTRNEILNAFSQLKQNILWKWEDDTLPGKTHNIKLGKWFPQQDVLAHPNIKLFITQGGALSMHEAIYNGVPILGIPIIADQYLNVKTAEHYGYGIGVPFEKLNEATLSAALNEILNNSKYAREAKRRSRIMHDYSMKPLDRAIYWIEFVIRHQGASHLKTAALNLNWFQYLLLDVAVLLSAGAALLILILYRIIKCVWRISNRGAADKYNKDKDI